MGFDQVFIDMVWKIMANYWYSIIINMKRYVFFNTTRGLKQGDPFSPTLFILGSKVLSIALNKLRNHLHHYGFFIEVRGRQVNHLSFADDTITFITNRAKNLHLIM